MVSLLYLETLWKEITLNFIIGLPPSITSKGFYNSVLVIVNYFTQIVYYIPTKKTLIAV